MEYVEVRDMLLRHWKYTGGPNEAQSVEIYHGALLELPQSHERFTGRRTSRAGERSTRPSSTSSPERYEELAPLDR